MRTPRRLALSAATAWLGAVLAVAVAAEPPGKDRQPPRPPMVAGELLVRLRSDFPECAHCLVASGRGLTTTTGTRILDQVRLKHGITQMEPVFGGVHAGARRQAAQRRFGAKAGGGGAAATNLSQIYLVRVDPKADVLKVAADFRRDPNVVSAEPNYLYSIKSTGDLSPEVNLAPRRKAAKQSTVSEEASPAAGGAGQTSDFPLLTSALPNDPFLSSSGSWGQDFPDLWGLFQIHAPEAWELSQGEGVVVAVVDTGIDVEHPDLAANAWHNAAEIPGNGIDDDGNGFVDDANGWDFTRCKRAYADGQCIEAKAPSADVSDPNGHGTHVAGTIAAVGDNSIGIIGVAPKAQVMAVKGFDERGQGTNADLAEAIVYAAENGAKVINASWAGPQSDTIRTAIDYVTTSFDVVVVAAAGNDAAPLERGYYPANLPNVVAVGATMHTDEVASFSNFGGSLDLVAPGGGDAGGESIISPERSILSLLSTAARQSDGWAAVCQLRCIACQDGRPPLSDGQPCPPNYCVETGDVCTEDGCHFKCVRCRDGTVLPPESNTCPNYDNTCKEYRETCEPGPWVVGEDYVRGSGTSFAAPHVSGVAALVRSHHPSFSQPQVRQVLRNTADDLGPPGWDEHFGYGRVNAAQAVAIEDIPVAEILTPENRGKIWERDFPFNVIGTVTPSVDGLGRWRLTIRPQAGGEAAEVASGSSAVMNGILGTLDLGGRLALEPGQRYVLDLAAQDTLGQVARDSKMFLIPNPQFAAIPVPDPFDEGGGDGSLSSDGQRLALVRSDRAGNGSSAWTFDNRTGTLTRIRQAAQARISPDGQFVLYADTTDFVYWRYVLKDIDSGAFQVVPLGDLWSATPAPFSLADYGRRVAFLSGQDVDPLIGNPDGSIEAFLFDLPNGPARQLTDGPRASFGQPEIEDDLVMTPDGQWLAFSGRTDLDPTSSTGGGDQVFVYDDGARRLRQISGRSSDGPQWGLRPSLSADGTKVAFAGDGIYLANPNSGTADRLLDSQGAPDIPLLSADATKLAFIAALDLDPGVANEDLSPELFLMDLKTMQIGQITDSVNFPYVRYGTVMDATGCAFLTAPGDLNGLALHPGISRFVRRRPGNRAPIIEPLPPIVISEGKISHVPLHAHDADGDPITFHVERNPFGDPYQGRLNGLARSVLEDHADGTADLQLAPCYGTAGQYGLRIAAFDGAGEVAVRAATLEIQESVRQPDINQDGRTDGNDLAILVESLFGRHRYTSIRCDPSDLNDDTLLSAADIVAWLTR